MRMAEGMLAAALLAAGACATPASGPVPIERGTACDACGMRIENLRYAAERQADDGLRMYDAIECLARDGEARGTAWLSDYDTSTLHAADSMWIVEGDIPSPMGGGLAAFLARDAADQVAGETNGTVHPAGAWLEEGAQR